MTDRHHDDERRVALLFETTRPADDEEALRRLDRHARQIGGVRKRPRPAWAWSVGFAGALAAVIAFFIINAGPPATPFVLPERWAQIEAPDITLPGGSLDEIMLATDDDLLMLDEDLDELLAFDLAPLDLEAELGMDALVWPTLDDDLDALIYGLEAVLQES